MYKILTLPSLNLIQFFSGVKKKKKVKKNIRTDGRATTRDGALIVLSFLFIYFYSKSNTPKIVRRVQKHPV